MSNLVFNPVLKDFFMAKACVAISKRYNYAGSVRSYRFKYLSFMTWSSSYRAAFCYVLKTLENALDSVKTGYLGFSDICDLFVFCSFPRPDLYPFLESSLSPVFNNYNRTFSPVQKLSFVYKLLEALIKYNLGLLRYDLVSPMFEEKSAIRYAASKYFPDTSFIEIESDFIFKDTMD